MSTEPARNEPAASERSLSLSDRTAAESVVVHAEVTERPLDLDRLVVAAGSDRCGAVVSFSGVIRNHDGGRAVDRLSYSAHPQAGTVIAEVAAGVAAAHPGLRIAVAHRVGDLQIGDAALVAAVAAAHRAEAFAACEDLIETVKARVPIWKQQYFPDGTSEWVGL